VKDIYLIIIESGEDKLYTTQYVGFCTTEDQANLIRDQIKNLLLNKRQHYINYDGSIEEAIIVNNNKFYVSGGADCLVVKVSEVI
jgi:hypothetical protein